jgi:hypothetical protein
VFERILAWSKKESHKAAGALEKLLTKPLVLRKSQPWPILNGRDRLTKYFNHSVVSILNAPMD